MYVTLFRYQSVVTDFGHIYILVKFESFTQFSDPKKDIFTSYCATSGERPHNFKNHLSKVLEFVLLYHCKLETVSDTSVLDSLQFTFEFLIQIWIPI